MYRSRLQRVEENRNLQKSVWLVLAIVGIMGLLAVYGLPLLVRSAVWFGNMRANSSNRDKSDLIPPGPPFLIITYTATNSAQLLIRGTAEPKSSVFFTLNFQPAGKTGVGDEGVFEYDGIILDEGNNAISAVAVDEEGNRSQPSKPLGVWYANKAPDLTVDTPVDGQKFFGSNSRIEIKGVVALQTKLTINNRIMIVGGDGKFSTFYGLTEGENTLVFQAEDQAGNQTRKEIKVSYNR